MKYIKLFEKVTDIVYHFTNSNRIRKILKDNTIYLSSVLGTDSDKKLNDDYTYYLSLTSSKNSDLGYASSLKSDGLARITFNGGILNNNFKSKRVDYWKTSREPNDYTGIDTFSKSFYKHITKNNEMEDRLLSNNNSIKNINKFIIKIEILDGDSNNNSIIKYLADKLNIPVYFYTDKKSFDYSIIKNSVDIKPNSVDDIDDYNDDIAYGLELASFLAYKDDDMKNYVIELAKQYYDDISVLSDSIEEKKNKLDYYMINDFQIDDQSKYLKSIIHNTRKDFQNKFNIQILHMISRDMKKHNCLSIKEYLEYKYWIGKKSQKMFNKELIDETNIFIDESYQNLKQSMNRYDYIDKDGYSNREVFVYEKSINILFDKIIMDIKKYITNYISNNDDMYKYTYFISDENILNNINIDYSIINDIEFDNNIILNNVKYLLSDIDMFLYKKIKQIKEEYYKQF